MTAIASSSIAGKLPSTDESHEPVGGCWHARNPRTDPTGLGRLGFT